MEYAVEIKNLVKKYGNKIALKNVNLTVKKSEIFGLIGPDGSGKSTLLKLLCGLFEKDEGEIKILGLDIKKDFKSIKRKIGYLSQEFNLYEDLTVDENIEFFGEIYKVKEWKKRREEILKLTNLILFRDRLAGKLSGGMKKKLALACTLIHEPEVFILDEPTLGVDPISRMELWKLIFELVKRNLTVLVSTSYLDEAERLRKIALIFKGEILYIGDPEILRKKINKMVLEVRISDSSLATQILKKEFLSEDIIVSGDKIRILSSNTDWIKEKLKEIFESNGIEILEKRTRVPSLEECLISLIKKHEC
ncbi:MAG: ABC transporter ATP-binding protein [Candidatus Aminicenantia bacterium]